MASEIGASPLDGRIFVYAFTQLIFPPSICVCARTSASARALSLSFIFYSVGK